MVNFSFDCYFITYQLIFLLVISFPVTIKSEEDPDAFLPPLVYIKSHGYIGESHYTTTEDNYVIQTFRIISPRYVHQPRKAVIIQHGLILSSMVFIINSPGGGQYWPDPEGYRDPIHRSDHYRYETGNNLGFLLADHGYDVWMPNSRGNTYSTNHTTLNPFKDKKYWSFSLDEMAFYDLPAVISHIQRVTGQYEIAFIGHSQGTTIGFMLASERPKYSSILKPLIMLAPIINITTIKDSIRHVLTDKELIKDVNQVGGPFLPHSSLLELFPEVVCSTKLHYICENALQLLGGINVAQLNVTRLPVYFSYIPSGTSAQNLKHYHQMATDRTRYFDYGPEENLIKYGQTEAPDFRFDRMDTSNLVMFWGENDLFCGAEEMDAVRKTFKHRPMAEYRLPDPLWSHMDFAFARQVGRYVHGPILDIVKRYPIRWITNRGFRAHS